MLARRGLAPGERRREDEVGRGLVQQDVEDGVADTDDVRMLEEAGELATLVAQACPNSEAALFGNSELLLNGVEHGTLACPMKKNRNWG